MVAAPVAALVVQRGDIGERGQAGRARKHALGEIRMQPDALPVVDGEGVGLVPHASRHADAPDVVHEPRATEEVGLAPGRSRSQLGDAVRVADRERGLQIDELRHRPERRVETLSVQAGSLGCDGHRALPQRIGPPHREERIGLRGERLRDPRIERVAATLADDRGRGVGPSEHVVDACALGHLHDPHRHRHGFLLRPAEEALAVPAFVPEQQVVLHGLGQPETGCDQLRHLAHGEHRFVESIALADESSEHGGRPEEPVRTHDVTQQVRHQPTRARRVDWSCAMPELELVTDDLGESGVFGGAADVTQERDPVNAIPFGVRHAALLSERDRTQRDRETTLQRLAHREIGRERERANHLGQRDAVLHCAITAAETAWGALTRSHAAAAWYWWISPPSRSRRRIAAADLGSSPRVEGAVGWSGGCNASARCGLCWL